MNRNTKQRAIIYDVVRNNMNHPDVDTIYQEVHKIDPKISKGTVYRNLHLLSDLNLIKQIKIPGGDHYDYKLVEHDHIVCEICGKVFDSPISLSKEVEQVESKSGFKILSHTTLYKGICKECLNKAKDNK